MDIFHNPYHYHTEDTSCHHQKIPQQVEPVGGCIMNPKGARRGAVQTIAMPSAVIVETTICVPGSTDGLRDAASSPRII